MWLNICLEALTLFSSRNAFLTPLRENKLEMGGQTCEPEPGASAELYVRRLAVHKIQTSQHCPCESVEFIFYYPRVER
ncbi:hypothetical protein BJY52DRAFT_1268491 [Lactarius psammicola]|nr:hypothetical protein BJY52DRAFT_1268491 [Lactarius psammicola]